ncbi:hypothetical protein GQ53DRAFT_45843 [Thozetella sp. PMI_491]|nr:hypothetical protein GQ53DRAFT_45843 [Thozetella sp. PMI_491]
MPPPHLHPRSRLTSSLFATTVVVSFVVVGLPHILPCPAPRVAFAEGEAPDGTQRRRRRRKPEGAESEEGVVRIARRPEDKLAQPTTGSKRECPVPKPGGLVGELLGFNRTASQDPRSSSGR